jgi:hypothetical protein
MSWVGAIYYFARAAGAELGGGWDWLAAGGLIRAGQGEA